MKNLSADKEEVVLTDSSFDFCANGEKILMANKIYDIRTEIVESLHENERLTSLGVLYDEYYCYYTDNYKYNVIRIELNDYTTTEVCQIPVSMGTPRLCNDKILFHERAEYDAIVGLYYFDIPSGKIVTGADKNDATGRYSDINEPSVPYEYTYDCLIDDNMYYFHYGRDVITRVNIWIQSRKKYLNSWRPEPGRS